MRNIVEKEIGKDKVGFFFGTKAAIEFRKVSGVSIMEIAIMTDKSTEEVLEVYVNLLMVCANSYQKLYGEGKVYSFDQACNWFDILGNEGSLALISELANTPEAEEVAASTGKA